MKALVVLAANHLEVRDIAAPQIGPYEALVQIEVCGICNSTDQKLIEGTMHWAPPFPFVLGHESVGRVVEIGAKVRKFRIGDRVTRPIYVPQKGQNLNSAMGGFAEFGVVRDTESMAIDGDASLLNDYNAMRQLVVPEEMSSRDAALAISLSETASVLRHLPNPRGQKILVAGTGVAGLAFTLWFKLAGATVTGIGRREERLKHMKHLGADPTVNTRDADYQAQLQSLAGGALDGCMDATGDAALAQSLLPLLKEEGFACAYGVPPTGTSYNPRWQKAEVEEHLSFAWVADLVQRGWLKPEWFVTHSWNFDTVIEALDQATRGEVVKGFINIG